MVEWLASGVSKKTEVDGKDKRMQIKQINWRKMRPRFTSYDRPLETSLSDSYSHNYFNTHTFKIIENILHKHFAASLWYFPKIKPESMQT